jgi:hypothetical protein
MPPQNRSTDASVLVRCTTKQKNGWEQARRDAEAKLPPGERLPLNEWILQTLDEAAERAARKR